MQEEIWKDVVGFEQYFRVSNFGRVFSKRTNKILTQTKLKTGYMVINTRIGGRDGVAYSLRVHRMVAEAFLENPSEVHLDAASKTVYGKVLVNHKDGNKLNNSLANLEWVSPSENTRHAIACGLAEDWRGENNPSARITEEDVMSILRLYEPKTKGRGCKAIATILNLPIGAVNGVLYGNKWKHVKTKFYG